MGSIATTVVGITGAIGLAVAGTATAKYWQVRWAGTNPILNVAHVAMSVQMSHLVARQCTVLLGCEGHLPSIPSIERRAKLINMTSCMQTDLGLYAFWAVYILGGGVFVASKLRK